MYTETDHLLHDDRRNKKCGSQRLIMIMMSAVICLLVVVIILLAILYALDIRRKVDKCQLPVNNFSSQNLYLHSAIGSDAIPCASIANNIMSVKGGNAIDGAIAGLLCSCSVNFHSCGIGGGSFMLIYNKTEKKSYAIDLRETAPSAASEDMFVNDPLASRIGGKAIGVMGLISGYYEIHEKFGKLSWKTLFEPTIDMLNTGFYISKSLEHAIEYFFMTATPSEYAELRKILTNPNTGKPKKFGDKIMNPKLANTMKILSMEPYAMKNGSLVDKIITEIKDNGGIIKKEDLNNYTSRWHTPISVNLNKGKTLFTLPPPSSGVLVAFSLHVLSDYGFDQNSMSDCENTALFYHRLIETMKFAFAKRSALGDSDFVPNTELMKNLTSESYAKWIKSLITDDKTHPIQYYQPSFEVKSDKGTSHFSLISPDGDAVSVTSTINYLFGSLIMGNQTGILYNDEMDDFSTPNVTNIYGVPPSPSNFIKPGKRPMSSMSPIVIVDKFGNVTLVMGASGGTKILSSTAMVSVLAEILDKDIKAAIDAPRVHHQLLPNIVEVEMNFPDSIITNLEKRGHVIKKTDDYAVVQGIKKSVTSKMWECNADFRKMGLCSGS